MERDESSAKGIIKGRDRVIGRENGWLIRTTTGRRKEPIFNGFRLYMPDVPAEHLNTHKDKTPNGSPITSEWQCFSSRLVSFDAGINSTVEVSLQKWIGLVLARSHD